MKEVYIPLVLFWIAATISKYCGLLNTLKGIPCRGGDDASHGGAAMMQAMEGRLGEVSQGGGEWARGGDDGGEGRD
jgi:hypothetical protein